MVFPEHGMVRIFNREKPSVYVLLFHPWEKGFERSFKITLSWLKKNRYHTVDPETLVDFLEEQEVHLPSKPILLTFDDGTLETYQIVYPMLKKFGFQGIAFVITTPHLIDDFKRSWWTEVDQSGWLRIESHSHSHSLIFRGQRIIDFYTGKEWNDSFLIKRMDRRLGAPIYHYGYELVHRRYYPEKDISDLCVSYVTQHGGLDFFKEKNWKKELLSIVHQYRKYRKVIGFYEKRQGWRTRIGIEVHRSKKMIEQTIGRGKEVRFFAYPWGAYNKELIGQMKKAGYRGAFTSERGANHPGDDPFKIKRTTITSEMIEKDRVNILK
jgi:peptidoglycan/xylan/chitin deacetylase (PgdA/CDA1 family)